MSRPQINIRLDRAKKEKWQKAAEETEEYRNLTHLIRLAVSKELSSDQNDEPEKTPTGGIKEESRDLLEDIAGTMDRVENGLSGVEARLRQLEERVGETGPEFSLRSAVREALPKQPDLEKSEKAHVEPTFDPSDHGLTVKQIAGRLSADESNVRTALQELSKRTTEVRHWTGDPNETIYWYRQVS